MDNRQRTGYIVGSLNLESSMSQQNGPRILVVDDDQSITDLLSDLLETEGYKVVVFNSSKDVLYLARQFLPDVLLLDIMMPEVDGYDVCRFFRADPQLQRTSIVVVTARDSADSRSKSYRAGADYFLPKPFDLEELRLVVANCIRTKRSWEQMLQDARQQGMLDPVAQCYSWMYMEKRVYDEIRRVDRHEHPLSLMLIDLDRLDSINARHGFEFGNRVLRTVVDCVLKGIRESDILGRYQQDAFLVILPETPADGAKSVVARIKELLELVTFPDKKKFTIDATIIHNTVTHGGKPEVVLANLEDRLRKAQQRKLGKKS
ncbi:MAG TPA: response regulator [Acidobacteriota bacterium]|nr:response regulator [Acidobacteriota bacterium]